MHLNDAAKSDHFSTIASIAGAKAHRAVAQTLLEEATYETFRQAFRNGGYVSVKSGDVTLPAGTTLYLATACGTARHAGDWRVYENSWSPEDEVTCVKCLSKEAPVEPAKPVITHKVGPKWTYIYSDGVQIAEVRSDLVSLVSEELKWIPTN